MPSQNETINNGRSHKVKKFLNVVNEIIEACRDVNLTRNPLIGPNSPKKLVGWSCNFATHIQKGLNNIII